MAVGDFVEKFGSFGSGDWQFSYPYKIDKELFWD